MERKDGGDTGDSNGGPDKNKKSIAESRAFQTIKEMSDLMETGLNGEQLAACVRLIEDGVNPEALAMIMRELRAVGAEQKTKRNARQRHPEQK